MLNLLKIKYLKWLILLGQLVVQHNQNWQTKSILNFSMNALKMNLRRIMIEGLLKLIRNLLRKQNTTHLTFC